MTRRRNSDDTGGCLAVFFLLFVVGLVILAVMWFVSAIGHVLDLTPTYPEMDKHGHAWIDARYQNVAWGYVLTVLTLVVGMPLSVALTAELAGPHPRTRQAILLAAPLIVLVIAIGLAPVGAR